jgi:hypothetical protein
MGETKELSKDMPEKTAEMVRELDSYLKKVGAWTMEEVYDTRQEELEEWIERDKLRITENRKQLGTPGLDAGKRDKLKSQLGSLRQSLEKHEKNIELLKAQRISSRWF